MAAERALRLAYLVTEVPEQEASERTHEEPDREDRERGQGGGVGYVGREEQPADHRGEESVDGEVEPLHEVSYRPSDEGPPPRRGIGCDLGMCRHSSNPFGGPSFPKGYCAGRKSLAHRRTSNPRCETIPRKRVALGDARTRFPKSCPLQRTSSKAAVPSPILPRKASSTGWGFRDSHIHGRAAFSKRTSLAPPRVIRAKNLGRVLYIRRPHEEVLAACLRSKVRSVTTRRPIHRC